MSIEPGAVDRILNEIDQSAISLLDLDSGWNSLFASR